LFKIGVYPTMSSNSAQDCKVMAKNKPTKKQNGSKLQKLNGYSFISNNFRVQVLLS